MKRRDFIKATALAIVTAPAVAATAAAGHEDHGTYKPERKSANSMLSADEWNELVSTVEKLDRLHGSNA